MSGFRVGLLGCGAIGSWLSLHLPPDVVAICIDAERVAPENLEVAAFGPADLGAEKARAVAARRRAAGGGAHALPGDVVYVFRPGMAERMDAVFLCLDNRPPIMAACDVLWEVRRDGPVLVLGCGRGAEHQVRICLPPGTCPACTWSAAERAATGTAFSASCMATSAPRASASAAEAAARAGARVLAAWRAGDRRLAGVRLQCDGGEEFAIRMPVAPEAGCPVPHEPMPVRTEMLAGPIGTVTVGALAEAALAHVGDDADLLLGPRAVPLGGVWCATCGGIGAAPLRLLPAALGSCPRGCHRPAARPLAERTVLGARELLGAPEARLTLAAWGAGHGDVFVASGARGRVRLACTFAWDDLEQEALDAVA